MVNCSAMCVRAFPRTDTHAAVCTWVLPHMLPGASSATVLVSYAALAAAQNFVESADTTECTLGLLVVTNLVR